jgi:hypothetical protein
MPHGPHATCPSRCSLALIPDRREQRAATGSNSLVSRSQMQHGCCVMSRLGMPRTRTRAAGAFAVCCVLCGVCQGLRASGSAAYCFAISLGSSALALFKQQHTCNRLACGVPRARNGVGVGKNCAIHAVGNAMIPPCAAARPRPPSCVSRSQSQVTGEGGFVASTQHWGWGWRLAVVPGGASRAEGRSSQSQSQSQSQISS